MEFSRVKKRVLFVITQSEMGGAQRFLLNLLTHLDKDKYETMVAIGNTGNGDLFRALHAEGIPTHRLTHLVRDINIKEDLKAVPELRKIIKEYRPSTVFLNSSKAGFVGSFAARWPAKLKNTRVVYRIGGWSFNDPGSRWQKWNWIVLEWLSAKWKDVIIVNNQHDFDQAIKFKIKPRRKLALVYNGVETYKLGLVSKEEARAKLELLADKYVIGTVANFYPAKGLEYLVRTAYYFQDNDNVLFVVIGDGRERNDLEALIHELGLENKILLPGQLPDAFKYLPAFDQ
ncbi:MAG: glycosyltransferase, partial [Candidatus Colwellbacteria bacterium]